MFAIAALSVSELAQISALDMRRKYSDRPSADWMEIMRALSTFLSLVVVGCPAYALTLWPREAQDAASTSASRKTSRAENVTAGRQPPPPSSLPDPAIPVRQAQDIGLGQCASVLGTMSRDALTSPYDIQSGWSRSDPTRHVFQSVAALRTPTNNPPDGLAALIAAPVSSGGCDGVLVQVFPLAGSCQSAQKVMLQTGKLLAPMLGTRIMLDARGHRVILLPAFANTCIAISVDTRFGDDPTSRGKE